jgi:hypothetical protein
MILVTIGFCDAPTMLAPMQSSTMIQANMPNVSLGHFDLFRYYFYQFRVRSGGEDTCKPRLFLRYSLFTSCNSGACASSHRFTSQYHDATAF